MEVEEVKTWFKKWIASIIDTQSEWGIEANDEKSVLILDLRGKNSKKIRAQLGGCIEGIGKNNKNIRIVSQAKYLGTIIGDTGDGLNVEIDSRIEKANKAMAALKDVWKQQKLPLNIKTRLYETLVRTILCYSLEVRTMSRAQIMRLETAQVKHLRRILKSPAHITHQSNEEVRKETQVPSIQTHLLANRLMFWKKQTEEKNKAVWVANWGTLLGYDSTKNTEEEKGIREDAEMLREANQWEENKFRRDKKNQLVIDKTFWETLSNCTKVQIRKVQNYKSTAEPNREHKIGPEEERIMECDTCKKKFSNKANLAHHKWAAHGKTVGVRQLIVPIVVTKE